MYQSTTIIGFLGKDPELRYLPNGTAVASVSVGVNETHRDKEDNRIPKTTWIRITCYDRTAENLCQYNSKGDLVFAVGRLKSDEGGNPRIWQAGNGESRSNFEMTAFVVRGLSRRDKDEQEEMGVPF